jgi:hypothetical protein
MDLLSVSDREYFVPLNTNIVIMPLPISLSIKRFRTSVFAQLIAGYSIWLVQEAMRPFVGIPVVPATGAKVAYCTIENLLAC